MQSQEIAAGDIFSIELPSVHAFNGQAGRNKRAVENMLHDFALILDDSSLELDFGYATAPTADTHRQISEIDMTPPTVPTKFNESEDYVNEATRSVDGSTDDVNRHLISSSDEDTEFENDDGGDYSNDSEGEATWYRAIAVRAAQLSEQNDSSTGDSANID